MRIAVPILCAVALPLSACGDSTESPAASSDGSTSAAASETSAVASTGSSSSTTTTSADASSTTSADPETTGPVPDCDIPVVLNPTLAFELVADGFNQPLFVVADPLEAEVLYVLERGGAIKRVTGASTSAPDEDWFTVDAVTGGELGLLGMAFHPDYDANRLVYLLYADETSSWRLSEYVVDGDAPDPDSARDVLRVPQTDVDHNGGMIGFGPDGFLYVSVGDGGESADGCFVGQDGSNQLGTILRINPEPDAVPDPSTTCGTCICDPLEGFDYSIPADNPFVGDDAVDDAVWAYGFRNPWRFSWDPETDQMYAADVGGQNWEEIDVVEGGGNYGWSAMEGNHCYQGACDASAAPGTVNANGMTAPIAEYGHDEGRCAVIGLGVYRTCEVPAYDGLYLYADHCTGEVWGASFQDGVPTVDGPLGTVPDNLQPMGGGTNARHDVFVAASPVGGGAGSVYRVTATPGG
ncbi:MAG: PQQ-dependent sugar dehydrogenase [Myxococcota bacterium]